MTTAQRTDAEIQNDVVAELNFDARIHAQEIGVRVAEGVVSLYGMVPAYAEVTAAQEAVHRVRGVRGVSNELQVRLAEEHERPDDEIASAALQALDWNAELPHGRLDVTVSHGRITLTGEVTRQQERAAAEATVRRLAGVRGVINRITIPATAAPADVKHAIEATFLRHAATDAQRITVTVQDGTIILSGSVRTWAERSDAEEAAWLAPGVSEVENRLVVHPGL